VYVRLKDEILITLTMSQKVIAMYLPNWAGYQRRLQDFDPIINTIYLFHATPAGNGNLNFQMFGGTFLQDARTFVASGRRLILTVGGANAGFGLHNRQESNNFIASFRRINESLGNVLSGLDWNNFEAGQLPTTEEMIFVSRTLREIYGANFRISTPPAPWRAADLDLGVAMKNAGVLANGGYFGPQYYDGPGLDTEGAVMSNTERWVNAMGQESVVVGFGVANAGNYWSGAEAAQCLRNVLARWPNIRGIYNWEANYDNANGNPFCRQVATVLGAQSLSQAPVQPDQAPVAPTQAPRADPNFVFHQGRDSWDGVSQDTQLTGLSVEEMKVRCLADPNCVGFNTNGYVKLALVEPLLNEQSFSGADQGLYVKVSRPSAPAPPVQAPPAPTPVAPVHTPASTTSQGPRSMTGTAVINGMNVNFSATFQY